MASLCEDEESRFFDAQEDLTSVSDSNSNGFYLSPHYDVWIQSPQSVKERRSSFLRWMGMDSDQVSMDNFLGNGVDRVRENGDDGAVLRSPCLESEFYSSRSLMSCGAYGSYNFWEDSGSKGNFVCRDGNFGGGMESSNEEEVEQYDRKSEAQEVGLGRVALAAESESTSGSSPMSRKLRETSFLEETRKRVSNKWLSKLRSMTCIVDRQGGADKLGPNDNDAILRSKAQRVKVRQCNKRSKELSALYMGQDIKAHEGSILTMKFSPDGQYLASGGEDGVIRLWQVTEDERSNELDIPELDPSCLYFTVNHTSEVKPLVVDKEKMGKPTSMRKASDSACVVFPPKVFRILEKPLHEFHCHSGEILDLSWSKNNYLLSSSEDKTVRLWRVGCDHCLKVFSHSNYVTCVQFNPIDENYFISGSIDGKVRIWGIPDCQVVDWTDVREIVSAVCYRPDGQGGIVGSITGGCRFFNVSDNRLQLDAQICLNNKKKPCRKITGFQFSPQDSNIVMVTCADSQVRVLRGLNVIGKYRGSRNTGNQISACFTSDGKHIVSASEDSSVYLWSSVGQEETDVSQVKKIRSCERFSTNASVAIPWSGFQCGNSVTGSQFDIVDKCIPDSQPFSSLECFSLSQEFFLESFPKASATWPEEKLPMTSPQGTKQSTMHKSQLKFLKASCKNTSSSHTWGMVIVTAGWDGRIRSFHNYGLPIHH